VIRSPIRALIYRLGFRPQPGTILYSPSRDFREAGALMATGFADGLDRARKDLTMTEISTTYTEYGYRSPDGRYEWPDDEGDLAMGHGDYRAASTKHYGASDVVPAEIRAVLPEGAVLVTRTWTVSDPATVEVPLPTTPNSVIRATRGGVEGVAMLTPDEDFMPWYFVPSGSSVGRGFTGAGALTLVEILHDEGASK
jgi:hypothetical protein